MVNTIDKSWIFHTFSTRSWKNLQRSFSASFRDENGGKHEEREREREAVDPFERAADRRTRGFPEPRHSSESEPLPACLSDEPLWCRKPTREGADGVARVPPPMAPPCPATWTGCPHRPLSESRICGRNCRLSHPCRLIIDRDRMFPPCVWISVFTFSFFLFFLDLCENFVSRNEVWFFFRSDLEI